MKKKNIATSLLLLICLIVTAVGASPTYASSACVSSSIDPNQYEIINLHPYESIEPNEMGLVTVQLTRVNSNTLRYRVTASSIAGRNESMSADIVLQRLENGRWVNRGNTIHRSLNNALHIDFSDNIDIRAHGSGSYRIVVTFRSVNSGMTFVIGPVISFTVTV